MGKFWIDDMVADRAQEVGAYALAVYVQLARWADKDGAVDPRWTGARRLQAATGLDRERIAVAVRRLEAMGLITVKRVSGLHSVYSLDGNTAHHRTATPATPDGNTAHHRTDMPPGPVGDAAHPIPLYGKSREGIGEESPRARATRIPVGWEPSGNDRSAAGRILDGTSVDIDATAEAFRDYWLSNGAAKADWSAAWRSWCRREVGYAAARPGRNGNGKGGSPSMADSAKEIADQIRRLRAEG